MDINGQVTISISDYELLKKEVEKVNKYFAIKEEINMLKEYLSRQAFENRGYVLKELDRIENL